jgi:4-amino-4-deoxy-L-arabinose transferase-like glycosyltransferase
MDDSLKQEKGLTDAADFVFNPRRVLASSLGWARAHAAELLCAALLAAMSLQMLAVVRRKSITIDEIVMIPAAYYHLAAANFQLVNEHPPLSKIIAAVPLLFVQPNELTPEKISAPPGSPAAKWAYQESFWEGNTELFESLSFWPRVPMIALTLALGILIFRFARELFGARAAVLSVALFALEPTVLAHGRVVQTDIPAAFGYLLLFYALRAYARERDARRAMLLGAAAGVAILAKFSMLLAAPVVAALFAVLLWRAPHSERKRSTVVMHAALVTLAALVVVNAAYLFQHRALVETDALWVQQSFPTHAALVLQTASALSYVLPTDFVLGVFFQLWHNGEGHQAGLLGMYNSTGWWYYFPVAFALKTTLPFLILSLTSLVWAAREWLKTRDTRFLWMLAPFIVYTAFVLFSNIDIGVRYYLPAYPFLFILSGALLERLLKSKRFKRAGAFAAVALLCWTCVEAVRAFPNHVSYMNQLASSRPHWWYLSDSNVEWGDDIRALAEYLHERGETRVRGALLGGFLTPHHYGLEYIELLAPATSETAHTRYTAIGASFLNGSTVPLWTRADGSTPTEAERVNKFDEYRRRTPEKIFGGSIYLYNEEQYRER